MSLSADTVRWVAHLARLQLTGEEIVRYQRDMSTILDYVQQLQEADTANVEPLAHPFAVSNVFREDEPATSLPVDVALQNAPDRRDDFFGVPAVFEG